MERREGGRTSLVVGSAAVGAAVLAGLVALDRGRPVALDEPLAWRWVRQAAAHPWRTAAGAALVIAAARLARKGP